MPTIVDALKMRYPNAKGSTIVDVLKSINGAEVGDDIDDHILNGQGKTDFYYDPPCSVRTAFLQTAPDGGFIFTRFDVMDGETLMGYCYKYEFAEEMDVTNPPTDGELCMFQLVYDDLPQSTLVQQTGRFCTNEGLTDKDKFDGINAGKPLMIFGGASNASVKTVYLFMPDHTEETIQISAFAYCVLTPVV